RGLGPRGEAALVLLADPLAELRPVRLRGVPEREDGGPELLEEVRRPARAEEQPPRDVAREAAILVPVLLHPGGAPHDVTEERVAQGREDAPRIARRERREHEGRRAERIVLVP